jgi:flagellar basal-body rod protein FlgG
MNNSMIAASVSMGSLQQKLDILADNIANVNTAGYKRKNAVFEDILTSVQPQLKDFRQTGRRTPLGFTEGWGSRLSSMQLDMTQGSLQSTGIPTDVALSGNAMFEVRSGNGLGSSPAYTRQGSFQLAPQDGGDRMLVTESGFPVVADVGGADSYIRVPAGYDLSIGTDGTLTGRSATGGSGTIDLGKLKIVQVTKPEQLVAVSDNLYGVSNGVNPQDVVTTLALTPGDSSGVAVQQGFLEQSNVTLSDEMTDLMAVQRAYQLSARALTSSEQMMGMANNLRA